AQPAALDEEAPAGSVPPETDQHPFCAGSRDLRDDIDDVIDVHELGGAGFGQSPHPRIQPDQPPSGEEARTQRRIHPLREPVVEGQHVVASRLYQEQLLQRAQPVRMTHREVHGLAEILLDVVELPAVLGEIGSAPSGPWQTSMPTACDPSLLVDRSVAEHFEVLSRARALRARVLAIEGIGDADPLDRLLGDPVYHRRLGDPDDFENRRNDVDHVMKLATDGADIRDPGGPTDDHPVAGAAEVRRDLLYPLERSIPGPGPTRRVMRAGPGQAELINPAEARLDGDVDPLHCGKLADRAAKGSLRARSVVSKNVHEKSAIQLAHLLERMHQASDLRIGVLEEVGKI